MTQHKNTKNYIPTTKPGIPGNAYLTALILWRLSIFAKWKSVRVLTRSLGERYSTKSKLTLLVLAPISIPRGVERGRETCL